MAVFRAVPAGEYIEIGFHGPEVPLRLANLYDAFQLATKVNKLSKATTMLYDMWSRFVVAPPNQQADALRAALIESQVVATLALQSADKDHNLFGEFQSWVTGSKLLKCYINHAGVGIPWHLLYVGELDLQRSAFDPYEESRKLLGLMHDVCYVLTPESDSARTEDPGEWSDFLISSGSNMPGFGTSTKAGNALEDAVREAVRSAEIEPKIKHLKRKAHHDQYFIGDVHYDHNLWILFAHGGAIVGKHGQRAIALSSGDYLNSTVLAPYSRYPYPLAVAPAVLMLSCRSGILDDEWLMPDAVLQMGASTVIAPHADVSGMKSIEFAKGLLVQGAGNGTVASNVFFEMKRGMPIEVAVHANIFAPIFTKATVIHGLGLPKAM